MAAMVQQNQITRESLVWRQGMANWTAAGQVPELNSVFGAAPPPLSPQQIIVKPANLFHEQRNHLIANHTGQSNLPIVRNSP